MSIYCALAGWSGNRERRDERTKRKRGKEKGSTSRLGACAPADFVCIRSVFGVREYDGASRTVQGTRKRQANSLFDNESTALCSDSTVVASNNKGSEGSAKTKESFILVQSKKVFKKVKVAHPHLQIALVIPHMDQSPFPGRVAYDNIRITVPVIETFRSLNKYLIDNKIQFHTYALDEERKLKVVIPGIPEDIGTDDIKLDFSNQVYPIFAVHRIHCRDRNAANFPTLGEKKIHRIIDDESVPAPVPIGRNKPRGPNRSRQANHRGPPRPAPACPVTDSAASFAVGIQTVMSALRTIKSADISEFARDLRIYKNSEDKLNLTDSRALSNDVQINILF
ncbi:hypothetical protein EVAR_16449_1 [Eumeta japonica]|uniref:Uncharacterized protein n=1 Tax=Eumeta variegata TaxID=151549 RepID=A0A4C1UKM4_EUMVA|nr:hypothetical protein EVAR_16449_1 [Eumeta japonica]